MAKKSYFQEVTEIDSTWEAVHHSLLSFSDIEKEWLSGNIFCVGSGGALSLAKLWQNIHESHNLGIAKSLTPFEFYHTRSKPDLVALFSASGKNHDILQAFKSAIARKCRVLIFTTTEKSALVKLARTSPSQARVIYPKIKTPRDGFLAVNSTIAISCLIANFEQHLWSVNFPNQSPVQEAISDHFQQTINLENIAEKTTHIISSEWGSAAGLDFEARLAESGLAPCFLTDPRNFGHGRFLWLERWKTASQIIFFYNNSSKSLINRFVRAIPDNIKCFQICSPYEGSLGAIYCIARSILLFGEFAKHLENDPGMPFVPEWGKKLHRLKITTKSLDKKATRNLKKRGKELPAFQASFSGVVLDFDGTIVDTADRFLPIRDEIIVEFEKLLKDGIKIGVATGRGKSAYNALKEQIASKHHKNVFVGLYNGTLINCLAEDLGQPTAIWYLQKIIDSLISDAKLDKIKVSSRATQISIREISIAKRNKLINLISSALGQHSQYIKFRVSAHSLDIIPFWASKITLVQSLCNSIKSNVLCIGDQGQIGGNDEKLLMWSPSISVGSKQPVSNDCLWLGKLSSFRESKGTIVILNHIEKEKNQFKLKHFDLIP